MTLDDLVANPRPGLAASTLDALEARAPIRFGSRLRALLRRFDGADLTGVLAVPDGSTSGALELLASEAMIRSTRVMLGSHPDVIAFARDGNGNALVIDAHDAVFFWDHDTDERIPFGTDLDGLWAFFSAEPPEVRPAEPWDGFFGLLDTPAPRDELERSLDHALSHAVAGASDVTAERKRVLGHCVVRAAQRDRPDVMQLLRSRGAGEVEALHAAARYGGVACLTALLEQSIDPNLRGRDETTALMKAATGGHLRAIELLLEAGADPRARTAKHGRTAYRMAVISKHEEAAKLLVVDD